MPIFELNKKQVIKPKAFRIGLLGGFFVYSLFGFLDYKMLPESYAFAWNIRIVFGIIILLPLILSYLKKFEPFLSSFALFSILLSQIGIYLMIFNAKLSEIGHDNYYLGTLLVILWAAFIFRINYKSILILTIASVFLYILHIFYDIYYLKEELTGSTLVVFYNNSAFFFGMSSLAVVGSFLLDDYHKKLIKEKIELESALEKSREGDRIKTSFLNTMSHEIRTPLNGIIGFTDILIQDDDLKERKDIYQIINNQGYQLLNILSTILEFSQLQKASDLGKKDTVKISGFINSLNKAFISYAQQQFMNNTRLKIEVSEKLKEASIHIYYTRFLSVTKAILENAVKFGKDGPVILSLDNVKENDLLISVRDHGIGLAEKEGHIVFQDFRQMDSGHDRKYDGIGMGLAMSNKIMEFMNGSIWYKKNEGLGTTFFIHLPNCLQ